MSLRVLALAAVATMLVACDSNNNNNRTIAATSGLVEIIHASPDAPNVNLFVNNAEVGSDVAYKEGRFLTVLTGPKSVRVEAILPEGDPLPVIPAGDDPEPVVTLDTDERLTVIAAGNTADIGPIVLEDTPPAVDTGEVRVRVLHAAPDAPRVDVYITEVGADISDTSAPSFVFGELLTDDALVVPAGTYQVRVGVTDAPEQTIVYDAVIDLPGGADLLVLAVANTGAGDSPVSLLASTGGALLEFLDDATPSNVRVVHASPDAPEVNVSVDGTEAIFNLSYTDVSDDTPLPPGSYTFGLVPSVPESATDPVFEFPATLVQGLEYSVLAVNTLANIDDLILEDDNRRIATEARLRLVHASPSAGPVDIYVVPAGTPIDPADKAFENVPFGADTGYVPLTPGAYDIIVTQAGEEIGEIELFNQELAGGGIYSAVAGDAAGGGLPLLVIPLDDFVEE